MHLGVNGGIFYRVRCLQNESQVDCAGGARDQRQVLQIARVKKRVHLYTQRNLNNQDNYSRITKY